MFRIDTSGSVDNQFTDGNPQVGQQATVISADWLNEMQEEVASVIEHAGIELDKGTRTQLRDAITAIVNNVAGGGGGEEGAVPTTRTVSGTGLATGGGPLSADLAINVDKASAAEIAAGTEDGKAVTPKGLADASAASNSLIKLPGGWLICVVAGTAASNGQTILTLPTTFPNLCLWAGVEGGAADAGASHNGPFVNGIGVSSVTVFNALDSSCFVRVIAFGR